MTKWICKDCPGRVCEYDNGREEFEPYCKPNTCPDDFSIDWGGNKYPTRADWKKKGV